MPEQIAVDVTPSEQVTAIAYPATTPSPADICLILGHGAGAGQTSAFMVRFAGALAARGIDTVTFNFLYTEQRRRLPDRNDKLEACYRRVIDKFREGIPGQGTKRARLAIGGKSMGGRIASQVAASTPDGIAGLVLLGYPLHPPGRPDKPRTRHLAAIRAPMLFVQGSRDAFGTPEELAPVIRDLSAAAEIRVVEGGDHSFKVPKRGNPPQDEVYEGVLVDIYRWLRRLA